jgi:DNA polymerase I
VSPFKPSELLFVDTETTGLRPWHGDRPFAFPLCDEAGNTWYTEWSVNPLTREVQPVDSDLRLLRRLLGDERLPKVFFNAKFDVRMLEKVGVETRGPIHDMGVAARVCNTLELSFKLKPLAEKYCDYPRLDETELQKAVNSARRYGRKHGWKLAEGTEADYWTPRAKDPSSEHCAEYALGDVERTRLLWLLYMEVVMKDPEAPELRQTYDFEMGQFWRVIWEIENRGIRIDRAKNAEELKKAQANAERQYSRLLAMLAKDGIAFSEKTGDTFNPGSDHQLRRILYSRKPRGYGLPILRRTEKSKEPSTDWKALREYLTHPFVQGLVVWRSATKAVSTYFGNYGALAVPDSIEPGAWCLHGSFNQLGAAKSSRLSANDPNLQNVGDAANNPNSPAPIQAREPFGPRRDYVWYCFDYSGQEMRIFACLAQLASMLEAFLAGKSIHEHNANLAWGGAKNPHALTAAAYSLELGRADCERPEIRAVWDEFNFDSPKAQEVAREWLRRFEYDIIKAEDSVGLKKAKTRAKNLGFADIFGSGVNGVIDMLYCTRQEAREMLDLFDVIHPGKREFMKSFAQEARERGYVHNLYGRRLMVDGQYSYRAVNYTVQGTGADMMKRAMVRCREYLKRTGLDWHIVMTVHDELVFEALRAHSYRWVLRGIKYIMESVKPAALFLPMPVECNRVERYWNTKVKVAL